MLTKICTKCGIEKDIELFVKRAKSDDGYATECKECHNAHNKKKYHDNIDENRAKGRANAQNYYKRHPGRHNESFKRYKKENPEKRKETEQRYRKNNPDKVKKWKKDDYERNKDKRKQTGREYRIKNKIEIAEKKRIYYIKNKGHISEYKKVYAQKNKEKLAEYKHQHYLNNIDDIKRRAKEYYDNNREYVNKRSVEYHKNNKQARIAHNLRTRIGHVVKGRSKGGRMRELIGCDKDFFLKYIESLWDENMSWGNYGVGKNKWSLDHIIPLEWFDIENEEECKKAFHYANTQPMWNPQNASKSNRYSGKFDINK